MGKGDILEKLAALAPVVAVRGNIDRRDRAERLPSTEMLQVGSALIYVLHDLKDFDLSPRAASIRVVISGHSHQPSVREQDGVLFLNPGSAGPRRFKLPVTIARLQVEAAGGVAAQLVELAL